MNKKSFLRGFGSGVLFTAVILGTSAMLRTSDSYVRSRALKLGMVEKPQKEETLFATQTPQPSVLPTQTNAKDDAKSKSEKTTSATPHTSASTTKSRKKRWIPRRNVWKKI